MTFSTPAPTGQLLAGRPLRRDAERSRERILAAAAELVAQRGVEVGYDEIARAANVGVGTVYRRFPERASLVSALFAERIERVTTALRTALDIEDPWRALEWFCQHIVAEWANDRGLQQILAQATDISIISDQQRQLTQLADQLFRRAQVAGLVRPDLISLDLGVLIQLVSRAGSGGRPELAQRYLVLVLDAIRVERDPAGTALPGPEPSHADFPRIVGRL